MGCEGYSFEKENNNRANPQEDKEINLLTHPEDLFSNFPSAFPQLIFHSLNKCVVERVIVSERHGFSCNL